MGVKGIENVNICYLNEQPIHFHWCGYFQTREPWKHEERINHDYELILVTEGILKLIIDDRKVDVLPGNLLLIPPHTFFAGDGEVEKVEFFWIHFSAVKKVQPQENGFHLPYIEREILFDHERLLLQQMQMIKQLDFPTPMLIDSYLHTLLTSISEKYKRPHYIKKSEHYIIDYIKKYVQLHYAQPITIEKIAQYFGYNKAYISHLFSRQSGETITQYMNKVRLESARQSLLTTSGNIKEIAYQNGFTDEKYFTRLFSKTYQVSPSVYKSKYGQMSEI